MESTKKVEPAKKDTSDTQARKAKQLPIPTWKRISFN